MTSYILINSNFMLKIQVLLYFILFHYFSYRHAYADNMSALQIDNTLQAAWSATSRYFCLLLLPDSLSPSLSLPLSLSPYPSLSLPTPLSLPLSLSKIELMELALCYFADMYHSSQTINTVDEKGRPWLERPST